MHQDRKNPRASELIDMQSLIESHSQPFVVINRNYRILAINLAYEKVFGVTSDKAVGQLCYKVSHSNDVPCHESGEDCPHANMFEQGQTDSCLHVHFDANHRMCQVRVTAYPLHSSSGELYMGELIQQLSVPEERRNNDCRIVGKTASLIACVSQLKMVAATQAPVLLQGETGTGKELAASYIHYHSPRADQPLLTVDCTVLTETLFEAEVFGHANGAFTGSVGERIGLFEQADGGTLFLDEIGELPMSQQAKLLRVLESGKYRRVGGKAYRQADVRIVCATNRHLWDQVKAGLFREDLYYRIACLTVRLPPLRERLDDIQLLAPCLLESISTSMSRRLHITVDALERLKQYDYPGNVRELRNILFIAAANSYHDEISAGKIAEVLRIHAQTKVQNCQERVAESTDIPVAPQLVSGDSVKQHFEAEYIASLLETYHGNRRQVAQALGVSERTLYRKLKRYRLK